MIVLLFALLHDEQQCPLARIKALVFQRLLNKFCLSGLQKAQKEIDGDLLHTLLQEQRFELLLI